ncbi:MAG: type I-C CRISPR-associated protein Cas5c, partial [Planctomycetota bacterium]|nr:type I-C CRISPR-associated protein Cas5c [Planctomycetota bacterium]
MPEKNVVKVKVWGELACFTRPELKVERMSYPIITPSSARGVLDAILFKKVTDEETGQLVPAFHWHIRRITALIPWWLPDDPDRPPYQLVSIRRNEIQDKIARQSISKWMKEPEEYEPYLVDSAGRNAPSGDHRIQRNTLALRDVAYLIEASIDMHTPSTTDPPVKYREMFERRVCKGQCFHRPYLGCREFACHFAAPDGTEQPLDWNEDLGLMLYDICFSRNGENIPGFFQARIRDGVLHCDSSDPSPQGDEPVEIFGWSD